jgi:hypothetical protein
MKKNAQKVCSFSLFTNGVKALHRLSASAFR